MASEVSQSVFDALDEFDKKIGEARRTATRAASGEAATQRQADALASIATSLQAALQVAGALVRAALEDEV